MSERRGFSSHAAIGLTGSLLVLGGLAGLALFQNFVTGLAVEAGPQSGAEVEVSVDRATLTLACPPGVIDPTVTEQVKDSNELWIGEGGSLTDLEGGGQSLEVSSEVLEAESFEAVAVAGDTKGDLASLLLSSCILPSMETVLPAGSTVTGEDSVLMLSNPGSKAVVAQVQFLSPIGQVLDQPTTMTIPPLTTLSVLPGVWAPDEDRLAVHVTADGAGVAAWLQSSGLDGEVPLGLSRIEGQQTDSAVTLVGLDPEAVETLRVVNMGASPATIRVSVLGTGGESDLGGTDETLIEAHGVFDFDLAGVSTDGLALRIDSEEPIAAALIQTSTGEPFMEDPDLSVSTRSLVGAAPAIRETVLASQDQVRKAVEALGFTDFESSLMVVNPGDEPVSVEVGSDPAAQTVVVDPGFGVSIPLGAKDGSQPLEVKADGPVHAAFVGAATSEVGKLTSVTSLREDTSGAIRQNVGVFPRPGLR